MFGIPILGEIIGNVVGIFGDWLKDKRKLKAAKVESELEIIKLRVTANIDWDRQAMINAQTSWKDEWFVILLSIPAIMAFIPGLAPYVGMGFDELAKAPNWYLGAFGLAVAASFGYRKYADVMLKKAAAAK